MKKIFAAGVLAIASVAAQATLTFVDGNEFRGFSSLGKMQYLDGVFDGLTATHHPRLEACLRAMKVTNSQMEAIVDHFMSEHPELWGGPMAEIAHSAFGEACSKIGMQAD
ncbi:hypothetical protein ACV229_26670 [Burkholderia sp. MR1-5-21]